MAMVLLNQNEELLSKIKEVALQLEEEKLKGNIFAEKVNRNNGLIE